MFYPPPKICQIFGGGFLHKIKMFYLKNSENGFVLLP